MRYSANRRRRNGFTIVELLIAAAITVLIVVMLGTMFGSLATTSSRANQRTDSFRDARAALQMIERDLSNLVRPQWDPDPFTTPTPTPAPQPITRPAAHILCTNGSAATNDPQQPANIYGDPADGNQQIFALIALKNTGKGDVCSVGYYCRWNDTGYGYSLRRFFRDSTATYAVLSNPSNATYVPAGALFIPTASDDVLAEHVWNLKVVAYDSSGVPINHSPFICDLSATPQTQVPASLEISFRAMSAEAARTIIAMQKGSNLSPQTAARAWMDETDPINQRLIKPHSYEFRTRIDL